MTFDPGSRRDSAASVLVRAPLRFADAHRQLDVTATVDRLVGTLPPAPSPRVLDRVIHARNAGAYGFFETFGRVGDLPVSAFTRAGLFQHAGARTPVFVRFSTVAHGGHGPETVRDPRGFAVRFHTDEGRWDLVGSSLPVSFVRDPTLFPSVAHAFRPEPLTHRLDPKRIFEFIRFTPSALHMVTWLFSPWGIPASYRSMCGFSAGRWVNAAGEATLVRYHLRPKGGSRGLTQAEADAIQARNFNHATQDLYESIARGECPEWEIAVQLIGGQDRAGLDFDPGDSTALWPPERFPLRPVGRLVLDRNPRNYFAEVEQAIFDAEAAIDGIACSATAPADPIVDVGDGRTRARELRRRGAGTADPLRVATAARGAAPGMRSSATRAEHHRRAGECYRRFADRERDELVRNLVVALQECDGATRAHMVEHFSACDAGFGRRVAEGLGLVQ